MGFQANRIAALSPGRYIIAVSGGIDSIVLLDMVARFKGCECIVAHFDHGIRDDSADDAHFVEEQAKKYGFTFETTREELGKRVSEEHARNRRYAFLRSLAGRYNAQIMTAHHADDVIETIAINLVRGTGWRGVAVLDSDVVRPLLDFTKKELAAYANKQGLSWHEDSTNQTDAYLRNRLRQRLVTFDNDAKRQLLALWAQQRQIKRDIDSELGSFLNPEKANSRYFMTHIDEVSGIEILRRLVDEQLTRPQLKQAFLAIKTMKPGRSFQAGNGVVIDFTSRNFTVKLIK